MGLCGLDLICACLKYNKQKKTREKRQSKIIL